MIKEKFKKIFFDKYNLIILIFSFLSLIPISFFIYNLESLIKIADVRVVNEHMIKATLSKNISDFTILFPFIFGIISWMGSATLSAVFLTKKKISSSYGLTSLIMGGLGIHLIILLILFVKEISNKKIKLNVNKKILSISLIGTTMSLTVIPYVFIMAKGSADDPVEGEKIKISLDQNNPNLLEIFSDGFDWSMQQDAMEKDSDFKDFNFFNKFMTAGTNTHKSLPVLWGGFKDYNLFSLMDSSNTDSNEIQKKIYGHYFMEAGVNHLHKDEKYFNQRTIANPTQMSDKPDYGTVNSGTPKAIKQLDPSLNLTNWSGARDANAGKWGISNSSPDKNSYDWIQNNIEINNDTNSKGARILTSDLITHRSFLLNSKNEFSLSNFSMEDQLKNLRTNFKNLINKLKSISKNGISAYDNTMIVIYGDHSNHEKEGETLRHSESLLMIKYPNLTHQSLNIMNNTFIHSSQLNGIINDYFENRKANPLDYFNDQKFTNKERPVFIADDAYVLAKWDKDQVVQSLNVEVKYDKNNKDSLIANLLTKVEE